VSQRHNNLLTSSIKQKVQSRIIRIFKPTWKNNIFMNLLCISAAVNTTNKLKTISKILMKKEHKLINSILCLPLSKLSTTTCSTFPITPNFASMESEISEEACSSLLVIPSIFTASHWHSTKRVNYNKSYQYIRAHYFTYNQPAQSSYSNFHSKANWQELKKYCWTHTHTFWYKELFRVTSTMKYGWLR